MIASRIPQHKDHAGPITQSPTRGYRGGGTTVSTSWGGHLFEGGPLDKLPWFNRRMVEMMLTDPICKFGLDLVFAPFSSAGMRIDAKNPEAGYKGFVVEGNSPEIEQYVSNNFARICQKGMRIMLSSMVYGQCGSEMEYDYNRENGKIEIEAIKAFDPGDVEPLVSLHSDRLVGCRVKGIPGSKNAVDLTRGRGLWLIHEKAAGLYSGRSKLLPAYAPFWEMWHHGGAIDSRRLKMLVNAHSGLKIGYPDEYYPVHDSDGNLLYEVYAGDLAQEAVSNFRNGGTFVYPILPGRGENGKDLGWEIHDPTSHGSSQEILEYPERLVTWILRGIGIPDNVIQSTLEGGTGTYGGRALAFEAFLSTLQWFWGNVVCSEVERQVMKWLVRYNFGPKADFHILPTELMPFQDPAMEQQQGMEGMEGGMPIQQGQAGGFGQGGSVGEAYGPQADLPGFNMSKYKDLDKIQDHIDKSFFGDIAEKVGRRIITAEQIHEGIKEYRECAQLMSV